MSDWTVYMLRCADDTLYTGIARDADAREATHNAGRGAKYTRARLPVRLVYREAAPDRSAASKREWAIKRLTRLQKLDLLRE
jgi:predicted GIY-YIG superfamily endonuclease